VKTDHSTYRHSTSRVRFLALAVVVVALLTPLVVNLTRAANPGQTITLGESLSDPQKQELLDLFKAKPDDRVLVISVADTISAMAGISQAPIVSSAYSSTALKCRDLGDGLDVTTYNITSVTPDLYAIALVTAGIGDATLVVAAPSDAPAGGMTALAGIFKTWDIAPCASGQTTKARQKLALEELALATAIGQSLEVTGVVDGTLRAGNVILETQKTIVTSKLKDQADIDAAVAAQETAQGITIPAELRAQLVDMLTRLAAEKIDWSTFSAGWTIERSPDNTRVSMTGDGIAIRNARRSATAQAAQDMTSTAQASLDMTATAEAELTQTAQADADKNATAQAELTQTASASLTQTAEAQPTITPTPSPTPEPVGVAGKITKIDGGQLEVQATDGSKAKTTYTVASSPQVLRGGQTVKFDALRTGDTVQLSLDGSNHEVIAITADPAPGSSPIGPIIGALAAVVILGGGLYLMVVKRREEPFIITLNPA